MADKKRFPNKLRIDLRVVFYQEAGFWVAHCLEMDVMGHGDNKGEAIRQLADAMATQIGASIQVSNHANIFMPADARFFEMYAAGKNIATAKYEIEKIQERIEPKDDVTLDTISYREYPGAFAIA